MAEVWQGPCGLTKDPMLAENIVSLYLNDKDSVITKQLTGYNVETQRAARAAQKKLWREQEGEASEPENDTHHKSRSMAGNDDERLTGEVFERD